jgi:taurine dioxygenase
VEDEERDIVTVKVERRNRLMSQPARVSSGLQTAPIGQGFGLELSNIDLGAASDAQLREIVDMYRSVSLLVVRDQRLSPDQLVRFASAFGPLESHTREQFCLAGYPTIYILSNKEVNGQRIGVHRDGIGWHTDGTYLEKPLDATLLYALEAPPVGGDTLVADMRSAFASMPSEEQERLRRMNVVHSFVQLIGVLDPEARSVVTEEQRRRTPDVVHPLVLKGADGSESLYLSSGATKAILGMEPEEAGRQLVHNLIAYATDERFVYRHRWREGDVLMWNNRHTLHTATEYDDKAYERLVYRLWVSGPAIPAA